MLYNICIHRFLRESVDVYIMGNLKTFGSAHEGVEPKLMFCCLLVQVTFDTFLGGLFKLLTENLHV